MKQTPEEKRQFQNFQQGRLSKVGFLGDDTRHVYDIIQDDLRVLEKYNITKETIAQELRKLIAIGKGGLESEVETDSYCILVQWDRGMIACPFGDPGLHYKLIATIKEKKSGKEIRFSQLCVHLIHQHGFFGGKGSTFRVEPELICQIMKRWISASS